MHLIKSVIALTLTLGSLTMLETTAIASPSPVGIIEPTNGELIKAKNLLNKSQTSEALTILSNFQSQSSTDSLWQKYLTGVALLGQKENTQALELFFGCYNDVKSGTGTLGDHFRIAGLCLKKIGWYYRYEKKYLKAFAYHNFRYIYAVEYGSPLEIHDALISLDVDAYFLEEPHLSESFLRESLKYGAKIKDEKLRSMALGTSYNNLGSTLYGFKKFQESEIAFLSALTNWKLYESVSGTSEFKLVWAHYGLGDAYEHWATDLKLNKLEYSEKKEQSLTSYNQALQLAEERDMPASEKAYITERIQAVSDM